MNEIQSIHDQFPELIFRMGLDHLMAKGKDHFDDETVAAAKISIRERETEIRSEGKIPFMTAAFQDSILDCAAALSKCRTTDIFRFVKHYMHFDGDEKLTTRCKNCGKELSDYDGVLVNDGLEDSFHECDFCHGFALEDGYTILCETCGGYYTPNHAKEDGESSCPYCFE